MKRSLVTRWGCGVLAAVLAVGTVMILPKAGEQVQAASKVSGTYTEVVEGFDWGPGVTKLVLSLNTSIQANSKGKLDKKAFSVVTTKQGYNDDYSPTKTTEDRIVTGAYTSDESGKLVKGASKFVTLELECSPSEGNPFYYSMATSLNNWSKPYTNKITLTRNLKTKGTTLKKKSLSIKSRPQGRILDGIDDTFTLNQKYKSDGITLRYAYHESDVKTSQKGVVVWLHGTGEGGTDTTIPLYGNKVTNLASKKVQKNLKGCDILVVQCPSRWLTYKTGISTPDEENPIEKYQSEYTKVLYDLIQKYVKVSDISSKRIYIGGASNGGSMTMNMLLNYPNVFAGAFFASEGYADRFITDEQLDSIKYIPMWFVYAEGDQTNDPAKTTKATYDRLVEAGATDVHLSYYPNGVVDTSGKYKDDDGTPHKYSAHWSWVYLLNNECSDRGVKLTRWLGSQRKTN